VPVFLPSAIDENVDAEIALAYPLACQADDRAPPGSTPVLLAVTR
jgi:hypothetical protein